MTDLDRMLNAMFWFAMGLGIARARASSHWLALLIGGWLGIIASAWVLA